MIKVVYIREKGWYNIKMQVAKGSRLWALFRGVVTDPRNAGHAKGTIRALLNIGGMIVFMTLTFMFYFMVAWIAILVGFMQANKRGSRQ
jgi:hypothetical protein